MPRDFALLNNGPRFPGRMLDSNLIEIAISSRSQIRDSRMAIASKWNPAEIALSIRLNASLNRVFRALPISGEYETLRKCLEFLAVLTDDAGMKEAYL